MTDAYNLAQWLSKLNIINEFRDVHLISPLGSNVIPQLSLELKLSPKRFPYSVWVIAYEFQGSKRDVIERVSTELKVS